MCVVSMVGDHYSDKWRDILNPSAPSLALNNLYWPAVTREEFDQLKKEVIEMKELLKKAKIYDEQTGQKDCEIESKIKMLREIAKAVGVDLNEIFANKV